MSKYEIRLTGSGGQGLITEGIISAEVAVIDGANVIQSQSYGPEARGGASKSEVIIDQNQIHYPELIHCDILLCLTQLSYEKYLDDLKYNGVLIMDESIDYKNQNDYEIYSLPILKIATDKLNKPMVANIVALGAVNKITQV